MALVVDPARVVHETVDGEVIIIQLQHANYYSLRDCGREIWEMICAGLGEDEIVARVEGSYRAEPGVIGAEVADLVGRLREEGLVTEGEAPGAGPTNGSGPAATAELAGGTFLAPKLEKYTDMQDFLLVDPIHDVAAEGWPVVEPTE